MDTAAHVLVIDDDPHFRALAGALLDAHGYAVREAASIDEALAGPEPDAVLLDWQLGEADGLEAMAPLRARLPRSPVLLVTAHSAPEVAVRALRSGAFEFLPKPLDEARLVSAVAGAVAQATLLRELDALRADAAGDGFEGLVGGSPAMLDVFATIASVAPTDAPVLVTGESGTGKELIARAVHRRSGRKGAFVALNMAALPRELVESTLFGHEKGAFSGADRRRVGACEEADGGTLFLDELGEMPLELQAKLLRFLEEGTLRRVGGSGEVRVDARVVSATNRDPQGAVEQGLLRADLLYRLNVVPIRLPALRERPGDVAALAGHAMRRAAQRFGKAFDSIEPAALALLEAYPWPGNVRELVHTIERVVICQRGPTLAAHMLPRDGAWEAVAGAVLSRRAPTAGGVGAPTPPRASDAPPAAPPPATTASAAHWAGPADGVLPMAELERRAILQALALHGGNRNDAARALGISAATLYRRLRDYGLTGADDEA